MKAALLPDRGVLKVAGDDARSFLHGLVSADILKLGAGEARFCALLSPQGKIIADFIVVEAPAQDGGGFFLDVPRAVAKPLLDKLNLYKLRSQLIVGDFSDTLGVLAAWDGERRDAGIWPLLCRSAPAGARPARDPAAASCGRRRRGPRRRPRRRRASTRRTASRSAFRRAASIFNTATPSRTRPTWISSAASISPKAAMSARRWFRAWSIAARARTRTVPVRYDGAAPPPAGTAITAGGRQIGAMGSAAAGRGLALLRLDRVAEAMSRGEALLAGGVPIRPIKPDWARFAFPDGTKAAE